MATVYLPYGYIDQFDGVNLRTAVVMPLLCRLRGPRAARILTLGNGRALNASGSTPVAGFPVTQEPEFLIRGTNPGDGATVNMVLDTIGSKYGRQGALRVHIPGSARVLTAQAVLDYAEIVDDGQMDDGDVVNWSIIRLYFQQLEMFHD